MIIACTSSLNEQWDIGHIDAVMSDVGSVAVNVKPVFDYTIVGAIVWSLTYGVWRCTDKSNKYTQRLTYKIVC